MLCFCPEFTQFQQIEPERAGEPCETIELEGLLDDCVDYF
jgi:hypothetical protein